MHIQWNTTQALKKNDIMPFAATGMDVEIFILKEVSQKEENKYHISHLWGIKKKKKGTDELVDKIETDSQT